MGVARGEKGVDKGGIARSTVQSFTSCCILKNVPTIIVAFAIAIDAVLAPALVFDTCASSIFLNSSKSSSPLPSVRQQESHNRLNRTVSLAGLGSCGWTSVDKRRQQCTWVATGRLQRLRGWNGPGRVSTFVSLCDERVDLGSSSLHAKLGEESTHLWHGTGGARMKGYRCAAHRSVGLRPDC